MSHGTCETVRIKAEVTKDNPLGFVVINKSDLTNEHELFGVEVAETVEQPKEDVKTPEETKSTKLAAETVKAPWSK